jgi:hypothetical protein
MVYGKPRVRRVHNSPLLNQILSQSNPIHTLIPYFLHTRLKITPHLHLTFPRDIFLRVFKPKTCMNFSPIPYVLYAQLILFCCVPSWIEIKSRAGPWTTLEIDTSRKPGSLDPLEIDTSRKPGRLDLARLYQSHYINVKLFLIKVNNRLS